MRGSSQGAPQEERSLRHRLFGVLGGTLGRRPKFDHPIEIADTLQPQMEAADGIGIVVVADGGSSDVTFTQIGVQDGVLDAIVEAKRAERVAAREEQDEELQEASSISGSTSVCLFWKHTQANGYLSNWAASRFVLDGQTYTSAEQYIMSSKARLMGDEGTLGMILATNDPSRQKKEYWRWSGKNSVPEPFPWRACTELHAPVSRLGHV